MKEILWDGSEHAYNEICRIYGRRIPLPENNILNIKADGIYINIRLGQVLFYDELKGIVKLKNTIV